MRREGEGPSTLGKGELSKIDQKREIDFKRRVERARPRYRMLALSMRRDIEAGRWDSVLVDDISGRLVAPFLRQLMRRTYEERGKGEMPAFGFYAGGHGVDKRLDNLSEHFKEHSDDIGKRTLLLTEHIASGESLESVAKLLTDMGKRADIATLNGIEEDAKILLKRLGRRFYQGGRGEESVDMYAVAGSGVEKRGHREEAMAHKDKLESSAYVAKTRETLHALADDIFDELSDPVRGRP